MKLIFKGITNDKDIWIKNASFQLASGEIAVIDRTITKYEVDDGHFSMVWQGCHICNSGKKSNYGISSKDFNGATFIEVTPRDDAPDGYSAKITLWKAED